ncbi:MAG: hypothetical protein AAGU77_10890, partial [Bacillota bacterium]
MKKLACCLLAVLLLLLCACAALEATLPTPSPSVRPSHTVRPSLTPAPTAPPAPVPTPEEEFVLWDDPYFLEQAAIAEACRVQTEDAEYYLDITKPIAICSEYEVEFPLYRKDLDNGWAKYMGTTGFAFQLCGDYIYIQSDLLQEDYPRGEVTRVVNLETGAVMPHGWNMDVFIPEEGSYVYYTVDAVSSIYKADPSLQRVTEYRIEIPEMAEIKAEYADPDWGLCEDITLLSVESGWII